jgi:DNA-binding HxlR family transcriptional regulator
MKKNIYSLPILRERCLAANWRYIECLCALADPSAGMPQLQRVTQLVQQHHRTYRGFDFFSNQDQPMLLTLLRGEFNIRGFANKDLRRHLPGKTSSRLSRFLKRLRLHGLAHKIPRSYGYRLSLLGQTAITLAFKLEFIAANPKQAGIAAIVSGLFLLYPKETSIALGALGLLYLLGASQQVRGYGL